MLCFSVAIRMREGKSRFIVSLSRHPAFCGQAPGTAHENKCAVSRAVCILSPQRQRCD